MCLKDEQMKALLASMVMQSLGKPLEETVTFANVNNDAAVYDKLIDTLYAVDKCKVVLSESGWDEFGDFNKRFFDPWSKDSACGFIMPEKSLIIEAAAVEAIGVMTETDEKEMKNTNTAEAEVLATVSSFMASNEHNTPVYDRDTFAPGTRIVGPAVIREKPRPPSSNLVGKLN